MQYKKGWKARETVECIKTLGLIGTKQAIVSLFAYLFDERSSVVKTALKYLLKEEPGKYSNEIMNYHFQDDMPSHEGTFYFIERELFWLTIEDNDILLKLENTFFLFNYYIEYIPLSRKSIYENIVKTIEGKNRVAEVFEQYFRGKLRLKGLLLRKNYFLIKQMCRYINNIFDINIYADIYFYHEVNIYLAELVAILISKIWIYEDIKCIQNIIKDKNSLLYKEIKKLQGIPSCLYLFFLKGIFKGKNYKYKKKAVNPIEQILIYIFPFLEDREWRLFNTYIKTIKKFATPADLQLIMLLFKDEYKEMDIKVCKIMDKSTTSNDLTYILPFKATKTGLIELLMHTSIGMRHHAKQILRKKINQNTTELKKYTSDKYPFDVRYYFKTAIDNPTWLDTIESQIWNINVIEE